MFSGPIPTAPAPSPSIQTSFGTSPLNAPIPGLLAADLRNSVVHRTFLRSERKMLRKKCIWFGSYLGLVGVAALVLALVLALLVQ